MVLLGTLLPVVALDVPSAEAQATCPAGSTAASASWGTGGLVWPAVTQNTGFSQTYTNVGGSTVDFTMTIDDPFNVNEDDDNLMRNYNGPPNSIVNWDGPVFTQTNGVFPAEYLTFVMKSYSPDQEVTFDMQFSAPVLIPDFTVSDIDVGGNTGTNAVPHESFQDEILLTAERSGTPVAFNGVPGTVGSPVITLNDAANGQFRVAGAGYDPNSSVNLQPTDPASQVTLATLAPITSMTFAYSNGQEDADADAVLLASQGGAWTSTQIGPIGNPIPSDAVGVSNNHGVAVDGFTICVGIQTIGDRVWTDVDGDGVQDPGEPGIPGVTVDLLGEDGIVLETVTTGPDGEYEFDELPPWVYSVEVSDTPPTYTNSFDRDGTTVTPDNSSGPITLNGTSVDDADFGFQPPLGSISGTVFADPDNDGVQNAGAGDTPIAGATVTLTGTDLAGNVYNIPTVTDANGDYLFPDLPAGSYTVTESQPVGFDDGIDTPGNLATVSANDEFSIELDIGESSADNDFAEIPDSSIAGTVFQDDDNNGEITGTDVGIGGATVTLTGTDNAGNAVTRTTATNPDGTYVFDNLRDGTYAVTETQPAGYFDGMDDAGSEGGDDTTVNDQISGIVLPISTDAVEYDFGEVAASSIAGSVFDQDNVPIPDTTITLSGTDDLGNPVSATTTTDPNGDYIFPNLRPGTYTVTETQPTGFGDGPDFVGSEGGDDTTNDEFSVIDLPPGTAAIDYDFSEVTSSIAGSVVDDAGNGIPGVTLNLTGVNASGDPVTQTTTTDPNGDYIFPMLQSGDYTVTEIQPIAYGDGDETAGSEGGDISTNDVIADISLPVGTASIDNDFAETRGSIAGSVFEDTNNNGAQDGLEVGIEGVTVELSGTDVLGNPVTASTTTEPDGTYVFPGLLAGNYTVTETQPASHVDGIDTAGSEGGDDTTANDVISAIPLPAGVDATDYDFGELLPASIAGTVFEDPNNDGVQALDEDGIEGVTVELSGTDDLGNPVTASTTTAPDGTYSFTGLRPGTYVVTETQPAGYQDGIDTAGSEGGDDTTVNDEISAIVVGSGVDATDYDFGEIPPSSIAGSVVDDFGNPIPDVTIELSGTDDLGNPVTATTTTDPNGDYVFPDLRPGTYTVTETQPLGYGDGPETAGSTGGDVTVNDVIATIPLGIAEDSIDNDFEETTGSLAGSVFEDTNNNGDQDGLEPGIGGVTVELSGTDVLGNPVTASTTTNPDGTYLFEGLVGGDYTVTETQPPTYFDGIDTPGSEGGDASVDDVISGVTLPDGVDATDYDFGELPPSSISGSVEDDFGNPIPDVTIELSGVDDLGNPVIATTTTDPNGDYVFPDLRPGEYTVTETQPPGYGDGPDTAGSTGGDASVDDVISSIPLGVDENSVDNDFEETTGSIAGSVFEDADNDGQFDGGEDPIEGVTVELSGTDVLGNPVTATTTTAPDGSYLFENLVQGTYTVTETQPVTHIDGMDDAGSEGGDDSVDDIISAIALPAGVDAVEYDFGEIQPSSIAGTVFEDDDNDGAQDLDEDGIEGVTVELSGTDDLGNPVTATTTTGPDGTYSFPGLRPGDYTVTETQPPVYLDGIDTEGSEGGDASTNDVITTIALPPFTDATDYDFGELPPASIAGSVVDDFGNPIPNVTLELSGTDDLGNPVTATTTTDPNGDYVFPELRPGEYTVTETQPPGYGDGPDTAGSTGGDASVDDVISAIPLQAGDDSVDNDFEETTSSIAGSVFEDADNDGQFDGGESPIEGVTVELSGTDVLGNPVTATTTTGPDGSYLFENLVQGTYTVTETQPVTHIDGMDDAGSEGGDDSVNDIISAIALPAGVDAVEYDFGEIQLSSISGTVFEDTNNDGTQDLDEDGIEGVTVELSGTDDLGNPVTATTTTGPDGTYSFPGLRPGDYTVTETQPPVYLDGIDTEGSEGGDASTNDVIATIALPPFTDATDYDFGELPPASIAGSVVDDFGNPIPNVTLELSGTDDLGNPVTATTTTDPNGDYSFPDLRPGEYTVTETQPPGYGDGPDTPGSTGGDASVDDVISAIPLEPGEDSVDNDFEETTSSIAGTVFEDANNNGIQNFGEDGIEGVTVELSGTDVLGNPVTATTTTGPDGTYLFEGLVGGTYTVTETQPPGFLDGIDTEGSEGGDASVNDVISAVVLPDGVDAIDYDFAEIPPASIAGSVVDDFGNPIEGVTVELSGTDDLGNPVTATTTTDPNGDYVFPDLRPGEYTVTETQPPGYGDGPDTAGSTGGDASVDDVISAIPLQAGDDSVDNDFEETTSSIAGSVFEDADNDGQFDGGEAPIEGVTVILAGTDILGNPVVVTTTTGPDGSYLFENLLEGTYAVTETQPVSHVDGMDDAGSEGGDDSVDDIISAIALPAGVDAVEYDFGEIQLSSISGTVFEDTNNDGAQDLDEDGIEGVTVELSGTDDLGNPVTATTTTGPDGTYSFPGLRPGDYTITETQPPVYLDGIDTPGSEGGDASTNDVIATIALPPFTDATDYDFGELPPASIAGSVEDDFGNPIEGVTVELSGTDDLGNPVTATTTTDPNGDYVFPDLRPGEYTVTETQPPGYGDGPDTAGSTGGDASVDDVISAIPLEPGEDSVDNDFEETTSSIAGSVFEDADNDGQFDGGEAPIEGVTVILAGTDILGNPVVVTTTTGPDGSYLFENLLEGTYAVTETQPVSHVDGMDDAGSEGGDDSVDDIISAIALPAGVDAVEYDFGEIQLSSISGTVFEDTNNDGAQDLDEDGIEGVTVELSGTDDLGNPVTATTTTGPDGTYSFPGLRPGDYTITETQPPVYLDGIDTPGSEGGDASTNDVIATIALPPFTDATDYDFGELPPASIAGSVVDDFGNPIEGVTVELSGTDDLGNPVTATTTTDPNGDYSFPDLRPGEYTVTETQPPGYGDGPDTAGSTGGDASVDDVISAIPLEPGEDSVDNDFEETTSSIAGTVFEDNNNDGVRELTEAGIEGVTLELTGTDATGAPVTATTTTGPDGTYTFDALLSGTYVVTETQPVDYFDGADLPGSEGGDATVDDVISAITLPIDTDATDYDFGEVTPSSISGTVEEDTTGDGVPDGPLEGVTVELVDEAGTVVDTAITDVNGDFLFEDVPPGEYIVRETDPEDYDSVSDVEGPNDNEIPVTMAGEDIVDRDFVDEPLAPISGTVEEDTTGDGVPDGPLEGVTVELVDEAGTVVDTAITDVNGDFLFEDVPPGEYIVRETDPEDYDSVSDVEGPNDNEIPVTMAGEPIVDRDFVDEPLAPISGTVEEDTTGDGVPDGPLEGVTVELVDEAGTVVDTAITDVNGDFLFEDVPPGEYIVRETDPEDYDSVSDVEGPNDNEIPVTMAGEDIVDRDFVDEPLAPISGTVEEDIDQDGLPDEPLEGIVVELVDETGTVVDTTITDVNGDFLFEDVPPGEYIVRETDPAAYRSVSDVEGPNDNEIPVTMVGEPVVDRDFVDEALPSSVSGNVRSDTDADGEPNEPLEGVEVQLVNEEGTVIATTTTGPDGSYGFTEVPPGTYTLVEVDPDGYDSVSDIDGPNDNTIEVTVSNGDPVTDQDFLDEPLASITGVVEEDIDHDGDPNCATQVVVSAFSLAAQSAAECPLAGVVIELVDDTGTVIATTTTDSDGRYAFDDVPPGDYVVREVDPDGYSSVSDVEGENDNEVPVTMAGVDINDRDFMDGPVFDIAGTVMNDRNGDGVGDDPIAGVTVILSSASGDVLGETTTLEDGSYLFEGLPPGDYVITEVDPSGFQSVGDNDGPNDNVIRTTITDASVTDLEHVDRVPVATGLPTPDPLPEGFVSNPTPPPATPTSDVPTVLALTGRAVGGPVRVAIVMIVVGALFVAITRRKSEPDEE